MAIRPFTEADYPLLKKWAEGRNIACPLYSMLPPTGFIADDVAAVFLIMTDCSIVQLDWAIADPNADEAKVANAFLSMGEIIEGKARARGAQFLTGFTSSPLLVSTLWQLGFTSSDKPLIHLVKYLGD